MKKAFLVDYSIRTRVIVDVPEGMDESSDDFCVLADDRAVVKILDNIIEDGIHSYFCPDNLTEIIEDTECPYGTFEND